MSAVHDAKCELIHVKVLNLKMCCVQFKVHEKMSMFNERVLLNAFTHNTDSGRGKLWLDLDYMAI